MIPLQARVEGVQHGAGDVQVHPGGVQHDAGSVQGHPGSVQRDAESLLRVLVGKTSSQ